jgi:hypothetical protein
MLFMRPNEPAVPYYELKCSTVKHLREKHLVTDHLLNSDPLYGRAALSQPPFPPSLITDITMAPLPLYQTDSILH